MRKIEYFACVRPGLFPGVENKLKQTVSSFSDAGYAATLTMVYGGVLSKYIKLAFALFRTDADVIIIRSVIGLVFCVPSMLFLRARRRKVIIDVPTPINVIVKEKAEKTSAASQLLRTGIHYFLFPLSLWPASRVLQYSKESRWFSFGVSAKTQLIANGINVQEIPLRISTSLAAEREFVMIGVASLADWHGFDRVIRGIASYRRGGFETRRVKFVVVGDGAAKKEWERLSGSLGLSDCVAFVGLQTGAQLNSYFCEAHVAISSIGLFRKGLSVASDLKSREYSARGIPFITSAIDADFDPPPNFVKVVSNDEKEINISELIEWYGRLDAVDKTEQTIRAYAIQKLDFKNKINEIIGQ